MGSQWGLHEFVNCRPLIGLDPSGLLDSISRCMIQPTVGAQIACLEVLLATGVGDAAKIRAILLRLKPVPVPWPPIPVPVPKAPPVGAPQPDPAPESPDRCFLCWLVTPRPFDQFICGVLAGCGTQDNDDDEWGPVCCVYEGALDGHIEKQDTVCHYSIGEPISECCDETVPGKILIDSYAGRCGPDEHCD